MIVSVLPFGSSFKGAHQYFGHDQGTLETDERVAWTHTHNLATDDPEKAWRVMAATAMSQNEIKAAAGIKNTGRKSHKSVLHYLVSWHPDERAHLSKEEMLSAALGSMSYYGVKEGEYLGKNKKTGEKIFAKRTHYLDQNQATLYCHDEGEGKALHVHVVANRVSPEHGVMVSDSRDFQKLSAWAMDYRQEQIKKLSQEAKTEADWERIKAIEGYCEQRTKNAAKRAQGVLTSHPRIPRNVFETEKAIEAAEPGSRKRAQLEAQRRREKQLKARSVKIKEQQTAKMRQLEGWQRESEKMIKAKTGHAIKAAVSKIRADYAPQIEQLTDKQLGERQAFKDAQATLRGRVRNTWKAIQTKEWMHDLREKRLSAVTEGFQLAFSAGLQEKQLENFHAREKGQLRGERTADERKATGTLRGQEAARLDEQRGKYIEQRNDLILTHDMQQAKLKAEWQELNKAKLAIEAEDQQALQPEQDASAERGEGTGSSGGQQPSKRPTPTPLDQQTQAAAPTTQTYDIPIDELRAAAQRIEEMETDQDQEQSQERDDGIEID